MSDKPLFRTNSFTGSQNPFHDILDILVYEPDQKVMLSFLTDYLTVDPENPDQIGSRVKSLLEGPDANDNFQLFLARSDEYRREFYQDTIEKIKEETDKDLNCCCWFTGKNVVLSRKNGYGIRLCKENGVLRCYDTGIILAQKGFDFLCAYETKPKLMPDTVTNNQLISQDQLNRLLDLEIAYGKILAGTCLKKDVLNLLKRADKGLLGNSFTPSFEIQERREAEERERIIADIL